MPTKMDIYTMSPCNSNSNNLIFKFPQNEQNIGIAPSYCATIGLNWSACQWIIIYFLPLRWTHSTIFPLGILLLNFVSNFFFWSKFCIYLFIHFLAIQKKRKRAKRDACIVHTHFFMQIDVGFKFQCSNLFTSSMWSLLNMCKGNASGTTINDFLIYTEI